MCIDYLSILIRPTALVKLQPLRRRLEHPHEQAVRNSCQSRMCVESCPDYRIDISFHPQTTVIEENLSRSLEIINTEIYRFLRNSVEQVDIELCGEHEFVCLLTQIL